MEHAADCWNNSKTLVDNLISTYFLARLVVIAMTKQEPYVTRERAFQIYIKSGILVNYQLYLFSNNGVGDFSSYYVVGN